MDHYQQATQDPNDNNKRINKNNELQQHLNNNQTWITKTLTNNNTDQVLKLIKNREQNIIQLNQLTARNKTLTTWTREFMLHKKNIISQTTETRNETTNHLKSFQRTKNTHKHYLKIDHN